MLDSGTGLRLIGLSTGTLGGEALGGGVGLGKLVGKLSDQSLSGIEVGGRPIPLGLNLGQLAMELLGRPSGDSSQMVTAGLVASNLVVQALESGLGRGQIGAQVHDLVLGCLQSQTCLFQLDLEPGLVLLVPQGGHTQAFQVFTQIGVPLHQRCFVLAVGTGQVSGESRYQCFLLRQGRLDGLEFQLQLRDRPVLGLGDAGQCFFDMQGLEK